MGKSVKAKSIILLAHQDDEIAILPLIMQHLIPCTTHVVYLTSGSPNGKDSPVRNNESIRTLTKLGIPLENISLLGSLLEIADKTLCKNLEKIYPALKQLILEKQINTIYTMAWEGGHPDHDAVHLLGVVSALNCGIIESCWQFPWYNAAETNNKISRVKLFTPVISNGQVLYYSTNWRNRIRWLYRALFYPSQIRVLVWLYPYLVKYVLSNGRIALQACNIKRINQRPTNKQLRYEQNNFYSYKTFSEEIQPFIQKNVFENYK